MMWASALAQAFSSQAGHANLFLFAASPVVVEDGALLRKKGRARLGKAAALRDGVSHLLAGLLSWLNAPRL
jgi:hypothetical protein